MGQVEVDLIAEFRDDLRSCGDVEETIFHYGDWVKRFAAFYGGDLTKVTKEDLKNYLDYLRAKGLKKASIKFVFAALSSFMNYLVYIGKITVNPVTTFRTHYLKGYKSDSETKQLISSEQAAMLVNSILDPRDKAIVALLFKTGMLRHELADLDVQDLDMEGLTITLKKTPKRTNRTLFFDQETAELLKIWMRHRESRIKPGEKALFVTKFRARISGQSIKNLVEQYAERVGLHDRKSDRTEDKFTPHCCRHWFTTHLRRAGMPRNFIQELRGDVKRESIDTYDHIDKKELKESYLAKIPRLRIQ